MVTVWGEGEDRGGQFEGMGQQIRVEVEAIWWRNWRFTKLPPNLTSAHPRAAKGPEPILHASWE
jgi:hypothetical protein